MQDWQQRLIEEYEQLKGRTEKLDAYRASDSWQELDIIDQTLLENQYLFMVGYGNILEKRIERFEGGSNA
jgi:hypothetical protein